MNLQMNCRRVARPPRQRRQNRALFIEPLESRRLLASDVTDSTDPMEILWPGNPRGAVELVVTDRLGFPISQVERGSTFQLQAWIHDFAPERESSAYAAYTDVEFDSSLVSVTGTIDHGSTLVNESVGAAGPGALDEVGGVRSLESGPSLDSGWRPSGVLIFKATMSANATGEVVFSANPADDLPAHDVVLVAITLAVDGTREIKF
jgi:hypothetical protein